MEEKNMALLGFISSAAEYLKDQLGDDNEQIKEVEEIDFSKLKDELAKKLDSSFSGIKDQTDDMISAGREAFNDFISTKANSLIQEFDEIFNIDFKKQNEEKDRNITNHLMKLLGEPIKVEATPKEEVIEKEIVEEEPVVVEEEVVKQEYSDDEIIDEYARIIAQNVEDNTEAEISIKEADENMDDVLSDIVDHEEVGPLSNVLANFKNQEKVGKYVEPEYEKAARALEKEVFHDNTGSLSRELFNVKNETEKKVEAIIELIKHIEEPINDVHDSIEDIAAKLGVINSEINGELEEVKEEEKPYVDRLIADLDEDKLQERIEETRAKEDEIKKTLLISIKEMYPYLSNSFIGGVYSLKDTIANEYERDIEMILLHRISFVEVEGLRKFVEVVLAHEYAVNVDEKQMIVDVFKWHVNGEGTIITDIFDIANQAKLLNGEYEGYRVIVDEEGDE